MARFSNGSRALLSLIAGAGLLAVIFLISGHATAVAASVHVTGTVSDQNGSAVQNVAVTATAPGGSTVSFGPSYTASDGSYDLDVDPGTYDFHYVPNSGSGLAPIVQSNLTVLADQVINIQLAALPHTLSGTVTDSDGSPIANLDVFASGPQSYHTVTDALGSYFFVVTPGSYQLQVQAPHWSLTSPNDYFDLGTSDVTQNVQVPSFANITITAEDGGGNPVPGASTSLISPTQQFTVAPGVIFNASSNGSQNTNSSGQAVLPVFKGMVYAPGQVAASFPGSPVVTVYSSSSVDTSNGDVGVTIQKPITHIISGTVIDSLGNPISNLDVFAYGPNSYHTTTDILGNYSITVSPGSYQLVVQAPHWSLDSSNGYYDLSTADAAQNVQVPSFANITITAKDGNGNPVSGATGALTSPNPQQFTVALGVSFNGTANGSGTTDSNGQVVLPVFQGLVYTAGQVAAIFPGSAGTIVYNTSSIDTTSGDVPVILQEVSSHTFAGTVTDSNGNPIANLDVFASGPQSYQTTTDASGNYSFVVAPGSYQLQVQAPHWSLYSTNDYFDLSSNDITQNIHVPAFANITITIKDSHGNPVSGATGGLISPTQSFTVATGVIFNGTSNGSQVTGASGQVVLPVFKGMIYAPGQVTAIYPGSSADVIYNSTPVDTTNGNASIAFQQVSTAPVVTSASHFTVNARDVLDFTITTSGPTPSLTATGTLPAGITFTDNGNGTASLKGQASPVNNGIYFINITATNSGGTATQQFALSINNAQTVPTILTANSLTVNRNTPFSFLINTTGNPLPKITSTGGNLPHGVSFTDNDDGTATISGTATGNNVTGIYTFTIKAKNKNGTTTQDFTLVIN